jgi:hypothetical protein
MEIPRFLTGSSGLNGITPSLQKSSAAKKRNVPDMNFIIRPYHEGDFPSVSLLEESGLHEPYRSAVFIRQMAGVCAGTFLVAVREDGVIGYTIGSMDPEDRSERGHAEDRGGHCTPESGHGCSLHILCTNHPALGLTR